MQFVIYLSVYSATQMPTIKQAQVKRQTKQNKHIHIQTNEKMYHLDNTHSVTGVTTTMMR
jgi:hypothetical protein